VGFQGVGLEGSSIHELVRYALAATDVEPITLAHILHEEVQSGDREISPIRYEGPKGTLEIIYLEEYGQILCVGPKWLLLLHPP